MANSIVWLAECDEPVLAGVGGKGASLCRLTRSGFAVPDGFVLAASAYRSWLDANQLARLVDTLLATPDLRLPKVAREASLELRRAAEAAQLPHEVEAALLAAYRELAARHAGELAVAVRSSALSEDGAESSSAGLYETVLNVRSQESLVTAVRACYCSLWAARAVQYRAFKGIASRTEAMAVVVMQMVPADVAGVAFTCNPISGSADEIVINASWALGEAVVSGRVTPDNYVVCKSGNTILAREISSKDVMVQPDPNGAVGTVLIEVPAERREAPALDDVQIHRLAALCLAVERAYGAPQDIEWALCDDRFYVLQSRPITAAR